MCFRSYGIFSFFRIVNVQCFMFCPFTNAELTLQDRMAALSCFVIMTITKILQKVTWGYVFSTVFCAVIKYRPSRKH